MQRGRHLDFADAIADAVHTCEMRAQELDDVLMAFMFAIPRVSVLCKGHYIACVLACYQEMPLRQAFIGLDCDCL